MGFESVWFMEHHFAPEQSHSSAPDMILAALSQFVGGWLLVFGACTRVAALMVASTMFTATVFNIQSGGPDIQLAGLYALVSVAFVLVGGGRWSIDRYLEDAPPAFRIR